MIQTETTRRIETISYLLGCEAKQNGEGFNWMGITRDGSEISIYYDINRPEYMLESVEAYDPDGVLGLPTSHEVAGISIMDLPKHFTRYR